MQMLYIFGTTYRSHIVTTIVIKRPKKVLKCTKIIIKYESDKKKLVMYHHQLLCSKSKKNLVMMYRSGTQNKTHDVVEKRDRFKT